VHHIVDRPPRWHLCVTMTALPSCPRSAPAQGVVLRLSSCAAAHRRDQRVYAIRVTCPGESTDAREARTHLQRRSRFFDRVP
jgi:hypothetical protein